MCTWLSESRAPRCGSDLNRALEGPPQGPCGLSPLPPTPLGSFCNAPGGVGPTGWWEGSLGAGGWRGMTISLPIFWNLGFFYSVAGRRDRNSRSCSEEYRAPRMAFSLREQFFPAIGVVPRLPEKYPTSSLRAKSTLMSEPRFSTPCEMRFFPREKGKTAFVEGLPLKRPFSLSRVGKITSRRG